MDIDKQRNEKHTGLLYGTDAKSSALVPVNVKVDSSIGYSRCNIS